MKDYISILALHPRPVKFCVGRFLAITGIGRFLTIRQEGYKLRFYPSNLSENLWINPEMRREALDFFSRYLRAGDKVIDVGANIGDVTQVSSLAVGSSGRVWSIEPHPKIFRYLQGNLALNRTTNVVAINTAVGEFQGELKFGNQRRDDMNKVGGGDIKVRVRQLDDVVEDGGPFALLKIDVEGYELFVLRGGRSVLERSECVYVEVSENLFGTFGYKVADLFTFLESEGFLLFIQTDRGLSAIDPEYTPKAVENVIATRNTEELKRRTGWSM